MDPALNPQNTFNEGKAAFMITVDVSQEKSKTLAAGQQQGFKWGAMLAPKGPTDRRGGYWVPDAIQLFTTSAAPDESWQLVKWLTNKDTGLALEPFQVPGNFKIDEFNAALGAQVDKIWKNTADPNPSFMKTLNDELQNILNLPR